MKPYLLAGAVALLSGAFVSANAQPTWSSAVAINTDASVDSDNDTITEFLYDASGIWMACGGSGDSPQVRLYRSDDAGVNWAEIALPFSTASDLELAGDGTGNWVAVVTITGATAFDPDSIEYSLSTDGGLNWSTPAAVATDARGADIASSSPGKFAMVYRDELQQLYYATYEVTGDTWSATTPLITQTGGFSLFPQIHRTGPGRYVINTDYVGPEIVSGVGTEDQIVYFFSDDDGATWTAPNNLASYAPAAFGFLNDGPADLASDGNGEVMAVWRTSWDDVDGSGLDDGDNDIAYAVSTDYGETWGTAEYLYPEATQNGVDDRQQPQVATDGSGTYIVTFEYDPTGFGAGIEKDLYYTYTEDSGSNWSSPTFLNSDNATDGNLFDYNPTIESDGAGNWVVLWNKESAPASDYEVFATRAVNFADVADWTAY